MPPATNTPPVASTISPRFPAMAPSTEQKIASAISQTGSVPASARCEIAAAGSFRAAASGRRCLGTDRARGRPAPRDRKREHVDQAVAREHPLARHAPVLAGQELHQPVLERRARRQVDVAPLGRDDLVAVVGRRPEQKRLAEPGAGARARRSGRAAPAVPPPSAASSSAPTAVTPSAAAWKSLTSVTRAIPRRATAPARRRPRAGWWRGRCCSRSGRRCRSRRVATLARRRAWRAAATENSSTMTSSDGWRREG